jgi:hypothetical protein
LRADAVREDEVRGVRRAGVPGAADDPADDARWSDTPADDRWTSERREEGRRRRADIPDEPRGGPGRGEAEQRGGWSRGGLTDTGETRRQRREREERWNSEPSGEYHPGTYGRAAGHRSQPDPEPSGRRAEPEPAQYASNWSSGARAPRPIEVDPVTDWSDDRRLIDAEPAADWSRGSRRGPRLIDAEPAPDWSPTGTWQPRPRAALPAAPSEPVITWSETLDADAGDREDRNGYGGSQSSRGQDDDEGRWNRSDTPRGGTPRPRQFDFEQSDDRWR